VNVSSAPGSAWPLNETVAVEPSLTGPLLASVPVGSALSTVMTTVSLPLPASSSVTVKVRV
jgi:hypothetical protein